MRKKTTITLGYLCVAAVTYGYAFNDELKIQTEHFPNFPMSNRDSAQVTGFICAVLWPIYWPFHASKAMWAAEKEK